MRLTPPECALAAPDVRERLAGFDLDVLAIDPAEAAGRIQSEHHRWGQAASRINLRLD